MNVTDINNLPYYDLETKNLSFLQVSEDLRRLGIKNNMFFLRLYDRDLINIDPHGPFITEELACKIMTECIRNPWYYLREVCRIPDQGNAKGIPYILSRANLAATWCFNNNIDHYLCIPRQQGKTQSIIANLTHAYLFGTTNSSFAFFAISQELASDNLERLKAQRALLPSYLQLNEQCVLDEALGTKDVAVDNVRKIYNPVTQNTIVSKPSATTKDGAVKLGRGNTLPIWYIDEVEFVKYVDEIVKAAGPAFATAAENAARNKAAYCRIFTSTPGDLDSQAGQSAALILDNTIKWAESWYDEPIDKVKNIIEANSKNGIVYIEYSYKQLGLDEAWFRKMCAIVNGDPVAIKREILLQRIRSSSDSPFSTEDLMAIQEIRPKLVQQFYLLERYQVNVYRELRKDVPYLVGIDCATGQNNDNSAITITNPYTLQIDAEFRSNTIGTTDLQRAIFELVRKWIPNCCLCIEKNHVGDAVIDGLVHTPINRNIYYNVEKELAGNKAVKIDHGSEVQEAEKRRLRGVHTGKSSRPLMMDLLHETVGLFKNRLTSHYVIDDILKLIVKKGKIEAQAGAHDDSIMSYLITLYVYTYSKNLKRWGIIKGMKEPSDIDADRSQEEDAMRYAQENMSDSDLQFFSDQMQTKSMEDYYQQAINQARKANKMSEEFDIAINSIVQTVDINRDDDLDSLDAYKSSGVNTGDEWLDLFDDLNGF